VGRCFSWEELWLGWECVFKRSFFFCCSSIHVDGSASPSYSASLTILCCLPPPTLLMVLGTKNCSPSSSLSAFRPPSSPQSLLLDPMNWTVGCCSFDCRILIWWPPLLPPPPPWDPPLINECFEPPNEWAEWTDLFKLCVEHRRMDAADSLALFCPAKLPLFTPTVCRRLPNFGRGMALIKFRTGERATSRFLFNNFYY
jgi:hypothetical protein